MSSRIYKDDGTSQAECINGIIYRKAFGESCKYENVVGEGLGIIEGKLKIFSGAFNLAKDNDLYQDDSAYIHEFGVSSMYRISGPALAATYRLPQKAGL